jgi:hypothetical protein
MTPLRKYRLKKGRVNYVEHYHLNARWERMNLFYIEWMDRKKSKVLYHVFPKRNKYVNKGNG